MIYVSSWDCVGRTAHELGHIFGLRHAHSESCTIASGTPVPMGAICTGDEYGDRFNVMGSVPPGTTENDPSHLSAPQKDALGWLSGRSLSTDVGTYTVAPLENQSASLHSAAGQRDAARRASWRHAGRS